MTHEVIGAAMAVHSALDPGLLESAYQRCLALELAARGFRIRCQVPIDLRYRSAVLESAFKIDVLVEEAVVVEVKSVAGFDPVHSAQLLTYLKLADKRVGLLINFNVPHLRMGIKRAVHRHEENQ